VEPDDLILPDPSEPTDESPRPHVTRLLLHALLDAWPFDPQGTILLALLYVAPFAIRWLVSP